MTASDAARTALAWLATYGLHSTLFLGGTWAVCALRPPRSNRSRERLWKLALVGGLLSATLQLAGGARPILGRIDWHPAAERGRAVAATPPTTPPRLDLSVDLPAGASNAGGDVREPAASERSPSPRGPALVEVVEDAGAAPVVTRTVRREAGDAPPRRAQHEGTKERAASKSLAPSASRGTAATPAAPRSPAPSLLARLGALSAPERWPGLLLGLWIATGLLGVAGLFFSWTCLRRRMLGRRVLVAGPLVELLDHVRAQAGVRRRVRLSVSPRISAPFSTGLFRAEVCVPTAVTTLARAQQEALLAHELAHIVRRDPAWFGLGFLIEKLFFFQPLNRLARRQLSELAEVACDDWAVRWTGARLALASCLTEVAGWVVGERPRLVSPPGLAGHHSRLGQRVARLLDDRRSPASEAPTRWWPPLAGGTLALVALAAPGVSAASAERAPEKPAQPAPAPRPAPPAPPPAAEPAAEELPEPAAPADEPLAQPDVLAADIALLESEFLALEAELESHPLRARFAPKLEEMGAGLRALRAQQGRARELLALLALPPTNTPAGAPEAPADALPPNADPGDFR